jgi:hypothetical protein
LTQLARDRLNGEPGEVALGQQWHDGFSAVSTKVVYDVPPARSVDCAVPACWRQALVVQEYSVMTMLGLLLPKLSPRSTRR